MISQRISREKLKRIWQENENISLDYVEALAKPIIVELTAWANKNVYSKHNGELSWSIKLDASANASAITKLSNPMHPTIEINLGMLREIYRDSLTFPIISDILANGSTTVKDLNNTFNNLNFTFNSGVPPTHPSHHTETFKLLKPMYDKKRHEELTDDMLASRFLMLELIIVWLYCHELGHLLQRHYLLQVATNEGGVVSVSEAQDDVKLHSKETDENFFLKSQAREILADLEGVTLAVEYMKNKKMFHMPSIYMLLCAQEIMFQRFSVSYAENFIIPDLKHPHPIIRSEFVQSYYTHLIIDTLVKNKVAPTKESVTFPMMYLSVRSSLMSGLFWANRYELFDKDNRPTFLRLSDSEHHKAKSEYLDIMAYWVANQMDEIRPNHLLNPNFFDYYQELGIFNRPGAASAD